MIRGLSARLLLIATFLVFAVSAATAFGLREEEEPDETEQVEEDQAASDSASDATASTDAPSPSDEPGDEPGDEPSPGDGDEPEPGDDGAGVTGEVVDVITVADFTIGIERAPIALDDPRDTRSLAVQIEADRRLLAELRKQIPEDRAAAELHLKRIRELAGISDPVYLVPLANNVIRQAPELFRWLETEYDDPGERERDYYIGGSWAFHRRFETFKNAVLLTVIRRLDAVGDYLLEQRDGRRR